MRTRSSVENAEQLFQRSEGVGFDEVESVARGDERAFGRLASLVIGGLLRLASLQTLHRNFVERRRSAGGGERSPEHHGGGGPATGLASLSDFRRVKEVGLDVLGGDDVKDVLAE